MNMRPPPEGVWKWIAALLLAVMLAGLPGIVQSFRTPSSHDFNIVRERQNVVLRRLDVLNEKLTFDRKLIIELQRELHQHIVLDNKRFSH